MIKKILPIVFLLIGLGAGAGTGLFLSKSPSADPTDQKKYTEKTAKPDKEKAPSAPKSDKKAKPEAGAYEYLKLAKQFVVPVVEDEHISALVTVTVSLEAKPGLSDTFYAVEPKLRDGFLQVLFDHANMGGFGGAFTHSDNLGSLRVALLEVAQKTLGTDVSQVLIMSMSRQDS